MRSVSLLAMATLFLNSLYGQIDASLFRYPAISASKIAFVYGGDIWLVPREGGVANRLTNTKGEESYPRFSPDGKTIAFSANYNGNVDIYTLPEEGGVPLRITFNSFSDRMVDWYPDGKSILFASGREEGTGRANQFFKVARNGGIAEKLPLPYGELGSISPDGESLAYVTRITENYPFKRYRGGFASDVLVYNLKTNTVENITKNPMTDGKPGWVKDKIFYVSDAGSDNRRNIWVQDRSSKVSKQITNFKDDDINYLSAGVNDLVLEAGGKLYLLNSDSYQLKEISIKVVSDQSSIVPRTISPEKNLQAFTPSPDGKRAIVQARGELFNLPAEKGYVLNLTNSSGAFERFPSWSPDGKLIAYWSDASGENELYVQDAGIAKSAKKITSLGKGLGWDLYWSPDSKKIAFIDYLQNIKFITVSSGAIESVDQTKKLTYSNFEGWRISWSPDSKWLAYSKTLPNLNDAIFLYSLDDRKPVQASSGFYNDTRPVFDPAGKYLYFLTDRSFSPYYSGLDNTYIYANTTQIAVATLDPATTSYLPAENDETKIVDSSAAKAKDAKPAAGKTKPEAPATLTFKIVPANLETRIEILPVTAGNLGRIYIADGKLIYTKYPNTGASDGAASVYLFDKEKREEKLIIADINELSVTGDGKSILVRDGTGLAFISAAPDQKISKRLPLGEMEMVLDPRLEWKQIFNDTWRRYRDFFYDPKMHQVNWNQMRTHYGAMVDHAITRWDLSNIQLQMISELSAGHTYAGGGDQEVAGSRPTGFLGIDWGFSKNAYLVKRIVRAAGWDNEVRSPFDLSGSGVKEGDFILAVNGRELSPNQDPYALFEGLSNKTITLKVNSTPDLTGAKDIIIKTLSPQQEKRLRHLEWINQNRLKVDQLSNGQLAYLYMPNTGADGQTELMRQFYAQNDKKGFVIDERFNAGGQLADRFLEMLNRQILYYISWRDADVTMWPQKGNDGPKVMLINGWAGSGGDAFPWAFQEMKLGPIIGERTLGILVGPATTHNLMDDGYITVPDARLYSNTGKWFAEGYGIVPDFEVWDDPAELSKGNDPQLAKAVEEALKLVKEKPRKLYPPPAFEDRTSKGLNETKQ